MYQLGKSQANSSDLGGGMLSGKAVRKELLKLTSTHSYRDV